MSDSVRPQRWQPTRLPRSWDSPGKNTGVGCHFLLQCRKVKSEHEVAQCQNLKSCTHPNLVSKPTHPVEILQKKEECKTVTSLILITYYCLTICYCCCSVGLFATPRTAAHQASLSLTISWESAQVHVHCTGALLWQKGLHNSMNL